MAPFGNTWGGPRFSSAALVTVVRNHSYGITAVRSI
jgi:hypothetical protein